jgi:uncharacterized membrane protein YraQ (UPF0718 family)
MRKEDKSFLAGVITSISIALTLNLFFKLDLLFSIIVALITGTVIGVIVDKMQGE